MKKIFLVIAVLVVIVAVGIGIFISTFNINTYKGVLVSRLEELTGSPVGIGRLWLEWRGRLLLGIEGLKIYSEEDSSRITAIAFDRAQAAVEIVPLLNRQLQISSISVERPQVTFIRAKDGKFSILGFKKPYQNKVTANPGGGSSAGNSAPKAPIAESVTSVALNFNIKTIEVNNGLLRFIDLSESSPADIVIRNLDASVQNVSLKGPVRFAAEMAIISDRQNIKLSGLVGGWDLNNKESVAGSLFLKDFSFDADLSSLRHNEVMEALPILEKAGIGPGLEGSFKARIRNLQMAKGSISDLEADFSFTNGKLILTRLKSPIEQVELVAFADGKNITLKSFSANLSSGALKGAAKIHDAFTSPHTDLEISAQVKGLNKFLSSAFSFFLNLDGDAKISFKGNMKGFAWPEVSTSLKGSGTISLENGVISNSNMVTDTLGALTLFPDLLNSVQEKAPEPLKGIMVEKYTPLKPVKLSFNVEGGYIIVPDLVLSSQEMDMRGTGKVSLAGDLSGDVMMRFSPDISKAMVEAVPQLSAITDPQGLVMFPLAFKGGSQGFKVIPDMKYIGQRVAIQTAGDAVSGYLQKVMDKTNGAQAAEGGEVKAPKLKDILKALSD